MRKLLGKTMLSKLLVLSLVSLLVLAGCGSNDSYTEEYATEDTMSEYGNSKSESKEVAVPTDSAMADMDEVAMESSNVSTTIKSDELLANQVDSRKYIRTFRYYMETLDFDDTIAKLDHLVESHFGFYQSSETSGRAINSNEYQRRSGSYVIRIPKEKVDEFTKGLEGIGHILDDNNFVDDVTGQYFDLEARIKTLRVQEERLLAILEEADELEYIIELERELSNVTYEIERYMTSFKELENQINYSTVYVDLNEVFEETKVVVKPLTFFEKMKDGFMNSVEMVINFFENLILFLTTNIPVFILLGLIVFIVFKLLKRLIRPKKIHGKKEPKKEDKREETKVEIKEEIKEETKEE